MGKINFQFQLLFPHLQYKKYWYKRGYILIYSRLGVFALSNYNIFSAFKSFFNLKVVLYEIYLSIYSSD